ncbi:hypothetical protein AB0O91_39160 [Kitasatospora sp. NPDC089797]|uniref:SCO2583/SCO2584 N-terminal domain-containing protein n=1 Tax=Kitasatospora sp. NPDC089797 TaxID=3155298 RepID=UPI003427E733
MPIADEPHPSPFPEPEPGPGPEPAARDRGTPDPFEGLVLDERFVRDATVQEPTARTRMLTARWREQPPVDPGGRRWTPGAAAGPARSGWTRPGRRRTVLIAAAAFTALLAVAVGTDPYGLLRGGGPMARHPLAVPASPRPAADVALPGGGVSDGTRCGSKGFHHFAPAPGSFTFDHRSESDALTPGPQLVLTSYGFSRGSATDPGHFTLGLGFAPGPGGRSLDLSAPLGPQGVAVEIEGPDGLVGGARGLPPAPDGDAPSGPGGTVHVGPEGGAEVQVTLPVEALCPGFDGFAVQQRLSPPTDANNTVVGQPPYRLTVSVSDPAIGALRRGTGSTVPGDVLATDNRAPR